MRQHGIGYGVGDFSQAVADEDAEFADEQAPPSVAARHTFLGTRAFRPLTTSPQVFPESEIAFGQFSSPEVQVPETQPDCEVTGFAGSEGHVTGVASDQQHGGVAARQEHEPPSTQEGRGGSHRKGKGASKAPAVSVKPPGVTKATGKSGRLYVQRAVWGEGHCLVLADGKLSTDVAIEEDGGVRAKHTTANTRWDLVEDYCFANGVHRSASSCKDKWENLLGEVKKVRDYQRKIPSGKDGYWAMDSAAKREAALPPNVSQKVYDRIVEALGGTASMDPPSVLQSGSASAPDSEEEAYLAGEGPDPAKRTTGYRKRAWGSAKKELIGTLKENGANLGDQLKASEEGKEKRFKESMEFEDRKLRQQVELEERRLKHDEMLGGAMQMMAQAFAQMVQQNARREMFGSTAGSANFPQCSTMPKAMLSKCISHSKSIAVASPSKRTSWSTPPLKVSTAVEASAAQKEKEMRAEMKAAVEAQKEKEMKANVKAAVEDSVAKGKRKMRAEMKAAVAQRGKEMRADCGDISGPNEKEMRAHMKAAVETRETEIRYESPAVECNVLGRRVCRVV
ncbi:hypothetical protein KFL_006520070 [Klebsormidium nitens]|uniref:Myb/SANT-like DNA-binding domain-containing protein n=1 Tax=Klebsormidium nitens TaxID=105231 RepID=A0A1Y1IMZ5_KLENI|nr:hypothetical protein KFL_006520070 [Klebsormidium nitens]|eukprot:GAQ90531.1 hypothetical protein KFL_006520070 [Klebsormidium nitens]